MKKYRVWVKAIVELDIDANNEDEAKAIAEDEWYDAMKYNVDREVEHIYCYDEGGEKD